MKTILQTIVINVLVAAAIVLMFCQPFDDNAPDWGELMLETKLAAVFCAGTAWVLYRGWMKESNV